MSSRAFFFVREGTNDERMTGMIARRGVWTFGTVAAGKYTHIVPSPD